MKIHRLFVSAIVSLTFVSGKCLAAESGGGDLKKEISAINAVLNEALPEEQAAFTALAGRLEKNIPDRIHAGGAESEQFIQLAGAALERLQAGYSAKESLQAPGAANALAGTMIKLHALLEPLGSSNFATMPVTPNVVPPPGSGIPAGGSPEGISDPVKREAYEALIAENAANAEMNNFHEAAAGQLATLQRMIKNFLSTPKVQSLVNVEMLGKLRREISPVHGGN